MNYKFKVGDLVKVEQRPCEDPEPAALALVIGMPDPRKLGFPYEGHEELYTVLLTGGIGDGVCYEELGEWLTKVNK